VLGAVATVVQLGGILVAGVLASAALANALAYASAAAYRRRHPPRCLFDDDVPPWPVRALQASRIFAGESVALALVLLATPLALGGSRRAGGDGRRRPLVLVHGYGLHAASFVLLARRLRRDGWPDVLAVALAPVGGTIERRAERLGAAIDRIRTAACATHVDVVAHGMGGLVARACVRARGRAAGIGRLVTLGTPHQGTSAVPWLDLDPVVRHLRPGSALIERLVADDPVPALADCTALYSADDAHVVPTSAGYWPGAFSIEVRGVGHVALLWSRRVYELVRENLEAPPLAVADAAP
jgi:triacylglycerol esterase/lipase EstA (alpha/beta hydrolase family)